jgi:FkbM family methyltransferase
MLDAHARKRSTMSLPEVIPTPPALRVLTSFTRLIPPLPHASGIGNRIVKPLWCRWHREPCRVKVKVCEGIEMLVDPAEGMGGSLTFVPQLFDRWERRIIQKMLPRGGTFLDVGANIGLYSLWAASHVGATGQVIAIEAEPANFGSLEQNVALNGYSNIRPIHVGVSDKKETLRLRLNPTGNSGGHSFVPDAHPGPGTVEIEVQCEPLAAVLESAGVMGIEFMKIDIEGFEQRVLGKFFADTAPSSPLRPAFLLAEFYDGRIVGTSLAAMLEAAGYALVSEHHGMGHNGLFARRRAS